MNKYLKLSLFTLLYLGIATLFVVLARHGTVAVLDPKGLIALKERNLMVTATLLMMVVVIPVFVLTFYIVWNFREGNSRAVYTPNWDHNIIAETIWWGIPSLIILALAVITWTSSHELDPAQPIASSARPMTIQVVALQWKWLFIYPDQGIATVNYVQFPENTPVNFVITSDAPMNSFWIPQLGGQIYAMPGMSTQLHLMASQTGSFRGSSGNISGAGFAGMHFVAQASSQNDFTQWLQTVHQSPAVLDQTEYSTLAAPSQNMPPKYYSAEDPTLYDTVVMKFMTPSTNDSAAETMFGADLPSDMTGMTMPDQTTDSTDN